MILSILATLPEPSSQGDILMAFLSLIMEGAPYILLGTLVSGFIDAYLPARMMERLLPRNAWMAVLTSGFMGLIFPVCECAVVPVIRRLVGKGLPVSCAITYMLAAPIINPWTIISTHAAFKGNEPWDYVAARLLMGYILAVGVGLLVSRANPRSILRDGILPKEIVPLKDEHGENLPVAAPAGSRLVHALRTTQRDFLDTALYFTIGALLTAAFNVWFSRESLTGLATNQTLAIPILMGLAFLLALCSTSDAFIAATLTAFSPAAKLAFLVFGPMMDIKLIFMYSAVFKKRFVLLLFVGLFISTWILAMNWPSVGLPPQPLNP